MTDILTERETLEEKFRALEALDQREQAAKQRRVRVEEQAPPRPRVRVESIEKAAVEETREEHEPEQRQQARVMHLRI